MSIRQHVQALIALVEEKRFLEAIERYYAADATMQENAKPPRAGLPALLSNETKLLRAVQEWHTNHAQSFLVDGDRAAIHWIFDLTLRDGSRRKIDEIAYQEWSGGKIVRERFFYDESQHATQ